MNRQSKLLMNIGKKMIILIDSHEKKPLKFTFYKKEIQTESRYLRLGTTRYSQDYSLEGYENEIGIQFKRLNDLYVSLGQNRNNFMSNCKAMVEHVANPYLFIAASPNNIFKGCVEHEVTNRDRFKRNYTNLNVNSLFATLFRVAEMGIKVRFYQNEKEVAKKVVKLFREFLKFKQEII